MADSKVVQTMQGSKIKDMGQSMVLKSEKDILSETVIKEANW
jgi:hypothetical protein